jgi:hypothetical protein
MYGGDTVDIELEQLRLLFFVLLGLVFVTLVLLIGYVVIANRRQRAKLVQAYEEDRLAPRPVLQRTGHVLSVARDEPGGALLVEIDGTRYRRMAEIQDPQIKRQLVESAMELVRFTGVLGTEMPQPATLDKTYNWREDLRKSSQAELERAKTAGSSETQPGLSQPVSQDVEEQFLNLLSEIGQSSPLEKPTLASSLQQRWARKPQPDQPRTFVEDIDDIVQRRIQLIPALSGRDLHLRPGPGGTVRFVFEGQEYETVDDIPNLTARQVVKDSVQEWEETG